MRTFAQRSAETEYLDRNDIPFSDIRQNLQELNRINHYLGGHAITISGIKALLPSHTGPLHIVEMGCGGGDNLWAIHCFLKKKGINARLTGIDLKKECVRFAGSRYPEIEFACSDFRDMVFDVQPDIVFNSLFCHHFSEAELVRMLQWMELNSRLGFFINDLHRHPLAYYSIRVLTALFSQSYLVKHDAPLSVARGFRKVEWENLFRQAGLSPAEINWKWAFRHLLIYRKG